MPSFEPRPFDDSQYSLDEEALAFFKAQTRIDDDDELKQHILAVQKRAYEVETVHPDTRDVTDT
jgi:hypothetical protein